MDNKTCINCIHKNVCFRYRLDYEVVRKGNCTNYYEKPKKGKWISITNSTAPTQMWNCSECGRTVEKNTVLDPDIFFPFCHCGADMREVN